METRNEDPAQQSRAGDIEVPELPADREGGKVRDARRKDGGGDTASDPRSDQWSLTVGLTRLRLSGGPQPASHTTPA